LWLKIHYTSTKTTKNIVILHELNTSIKISLLFGKEKEMRELKKTVQTFLMLGKIFWLK
jgi:hypothetical protein